jgi:hypothetical protein
MYNLITTGYSDQLMTFRMDDITGKVNTMGQMKIGENASFGLVNNVTRWLVFILLFITVNIQAEVKDRRNRKAKIISGSILS